jgi:membrane protein YqaA with SNARE-associated domain
MIGNIIDALRSIGPAGIVIIAILDSSFLSIPEVNDIIIVATVAQRPDLFFLWPFLTTIGSVTGCLILYSVARKGGKAFLHRWFSAHRIEAVEKIYAKYGALTIIIPALCPPPTPFKIFIATAGALQFPPKQFILTVVFARSVRYYGEALLALLYGEQVEQFLREHALMVAAIIMAIVLVAFFIIRLVESQLVARYRHQKEVTSVRKDGRACA